MAKRTQKCARLLSFGLVAGALGNSAIPLVEQAIARDIEMSPISGPLDNPRRHFRLRNPANLEPKEAESIYEIVLPALLTGYQRSGHSAATDYPTWPRFNTAPYLSVTHGNHYLSNYVNDIGQDYAKLAPGEKMPVGSVIAKDSFAFTETRQIVLGPLFIMEKMPPGFSDLTGDWKYTQIQPDGTLLGETGGKGADKVSYCIGCHAAAEAQDYLYFVPQAYRTGIGK